MKPIFVIQKIHNLQNKYKNELSCLIEFPKPNFKTENAINKIQSYDKNCDLQVLFESSIEKRLRIPKSILKIELGMSFNLEYQPEGNITEYWSVQKLCKMRSLLLPPVIQGMKVLNKNLLRKEISVPVLQVNQDIVKCAIGCVKLYLLKLQNFKPIQDVDVGIKRIFLNPNMVSSFDSFSEINKHKLNDLQIKESNLTHVQLCLKYEHWTMQEILHAILPESEMLSSFSAVGHIIHVNLRENQLPYKGLIGAVLLDKVKSCRTVVNKVDIIDNKYRNFKMEVIAGDSDMITIVKENNCNFEFDFSEVYWNPRLSTEHTRILSKINHFDILYDVFCGIGPFAIPAAKTGCSVLANDLNSASCKWLKYNSKKNKIDRQISIYNEDGFSFITNVVKKDLQKRISESMYSPTTKIHVTMNLPSIAYTFLPAFIGLLNASDLNNLPDFLLPIVHLYSFTKDEKDPETAVKDLVEKTLNTTLSDNLLEIICVRTVAPNKLMMRISFFLTKEILGRVTNKRNIRDLEESKLFSKKISCSDS